MMEGRKKVYGKGMPDNSYLVKTCIILHISQASQDFPNLSQIGDATETVEQFSDTRG